MIFTELYCINFTMKMLNKILSGNNLKQFKLDCKHLGTKAPLVFKKPKFEKIKFNYMAQSMGHVAVSAKLSEHENEKREDNANVNIDMVFNVPSGEYEFERIVYDNRPKKNILDFDYLLDTVTGVEVIVKEASILTDAEREKRERIRKFKTGEIKKEKREQRFNKLIVNIGNVINDNYIMGKEYLTIVLYVEYGTRFTEDMLKLASLSKIDAESEEFTHGIVLAKRPIIEDL